MMAVSIKSADMELIAYDGGTVERTVTVDVDAGEMLVLSLYGTGTINSLSEDMVNVNGNSDLEPLETGRFNSKLWLFHFAPDVPVTEIVMNVSAFYALAGVIVAQGSDVRFVEADVYMIQDVVREVGAPIALDTAPASRSGYRFAIGGGTIYFPF